MKVLLVPVILFLGDFFNIHLPNETIETLRVTFGENSIISILNPIAASFSFGYLIDFFVIKRIFPFIEFYHEKNLRDRLIASLIAIFGIISAIKLIFDVYVLFAS